MSFLKDIIKIDPQKISYGSTAAIITNLGFIIGLNAANGNKYSIIGSLIILALVDNVSDAMGIHVYQDSLNISIKQAWAFTLTNFIARFSLSLIFILIILFLPYNFAIYLSIIWGLLVLAIISYIISKHRKISPYRMIIEHSIIAILVIIFSKYFGAFILSVLMKS